MIRRFFKSIEKLTADDVLPLDEVVAQLAFNEEGLIPVITQDDESGDVLMFAWMNKAALEKTLTTGRITYWSRSRDELWEKGLTSGHTQQLVSISFDCDGDAVFCRVNQKGAACHTGRLNCFYLQVNREANQVRLNAASS